MDQSPGEVGIRVYTPTRPAADPAATRTATPTAVSSLPTVPTAPKSKRQAVSNGVQKTISKTSTLISFLPTGTLLTFEMVLPSIYRTGVCSSVTTLMTVVLLSLCTLSCFFFHFTDSFRAPDGKLYYGFVTPRGLAVFKPDLDFQVPKDDQFRLAFSDVVHALMSALVFLAVAFSDQRVTGCLFPGHQKEMVQVMESFPLMIGILCSGMFLIFPNTRHGLGCLSA